MRYIVQNPAFFHWPLYCQICFTSKYITTVNKLLVSCIARLCWLIISLTQEFWKLHLITRLTLLLTYIMIKNYISYIPQGHCRACHYKIIFSSLHPSTWNAIPHSAAFNDVLYNKALRHLQGLSIHFILLGSTSNVNV